MEEKVLKTLQDVDYNGPLLDKAEFTKALKNGAKSPEFTQLVCFLTNELRSLCSIDEQVNAISNPEDSVAFLMELSSFLKELGCSYTALTQGHISDRLSTVSDCLLLVDYLVGQLMAARMIHDKKPEKKIELKLQETQEAADMRHILMTLRFPKPPPNITVQQLFQKLKPTLQTTLQKAGNDLLGTAIFNGTLSDKQWETLGQVQKELNSEYTIRREMLLKRLDCTIQSFQWSDKIKEKEELIEKIYMEKRKRLKVEPDIDLSDLLSARNDMAIIEKTSSSSVRKNTQSSVNKVIIGQVPDRGGRTSEQAPPPPEMPSWQPRSAGGPSGGRGGVRGGGRGGGRGDFSNTRGGQRPQTANYSHGGVGGFDSAGSFGGNSSFQRVGNDYNRGNESYNYNKGDYDNRRGDNSRGNSSYKRGGNDHNRSYSNSSDYNRGGTRSYDNSSSGYGGGNSYSRGGFDSAGSYGGYGNEPKRPKTYDSFQTNKTNYADQYVQESQHNQQYQQRDNRGGRGRSNYNRGGGGGGGGYSTYR